jgi:hypothetical protein
VLNETHTVKTHIQVLDYNKTESPIPSLNSELDSELEFRARIRVLIRARFRSRIWARFRARFQARILGSVYSISRLYISTLVNCRIQFPSRLNQNLNDVFLDACWHSSTNFRNRLFDSLHVILLIYKHTYTNKPRRKYKFLGKGKLLALRVSTLVLWY